MVYGELSAWNRWELRCYRRLGVDRFRRAVLRLERIRHRKDARRNENYHPAGGDLFALKKYRGFLLYNACLHGVSLLFIALYALLAGAAGLRSGVLDGGMAVLAVVNVYCILLQRDTCLKLRSSCSRYVRQTLRRTGGCTDRELQGVGDPRQVRADLEVLGRLKAAFEGRGDCELGAGDVESLRRLSRWIAPAAARPAAACPTAAGGGRTGVLEACRAHRGPYTVLQKRADRLQRRLGLPGPGVLDHPVILTRDAACEALYRAMVPEDTPKNLNVFYIQLCRVFTGVIDGMKADEV